MRGANGNSRALNNTFETIHAAATAIASAENRVPQATVQVNYFLFFFLSYYLILVVLFMFMIRGFKICFVDYGVLLLCKFVAFFGSSLFESFFKFDL